MSNAHEWRRRGGILLAAVAFLGCDESLLTLESGSAEVTRQSSSVPLTSADGALPAFPQPRDWIPRIRIDLPPTARAFDRSDDALVEAITKAEGRAFIGFRHPGLSAR